MTIRVVLADDQPLVRVGLRVLINDTPGIDVAGEAATGAQAVQLARDARPDVVVMDIRMPGMDGIEATRLITAGDEPPRVVILTTSSPVSPPRPRPRRQRPPHPRPTRPGAASRASPNGNARC